MSESLCCSQCGAPLPGTGICAVCAAVFLRGEPTAAGSEPFVPPTVAELAGKFPQLEILELIGKGGMGAVYRARQPELDRIVALKILPPGIGDDSFADRFAREARALAKLSHPNIVTLFEFGRAEDGSYFFLMEFVDGVNLGQLLLAERVSPREALEIVPQICDALQFAHDHGIVHRDIKPGNILLDRRGRVKVADFGLAKLMDAATETFGEGIAVTGDLTESGKILGTPSYMAPEQAGQPDAVDHRADIYALGVVFYQMLTGELPGKSLVPPSSRMRGIRIDVRLDEVVLRALEKNPDRRYAQASMMKTQVEEVAADGEERSERSWEKGGWRAWFSTHSASSREIAAHLNAEEKRESAMRGLMFSLWNVCTFFLPMFLAFFWMPSAGGWLLAAAVFVIGVAGFPIWRKIQFEFLGSTVWAKQHGIRPESLRKEADASSASQSWLLFLAGLVSLPGALVALDTVVPNGPLRLPLMAALFLVYGYAIRWRRNGTSALHRHRERWLLGAFALVAVLAFGILIIKNGTAMLSRVGANGVKARHELPQENGGAAADAVKAWLGLMDDGEYAKAWRDAAPSFHQAITKEDWAAKSRQVRQPLGKVLSRKMESSRRVDTMPGMPDGSYFVAEFRTAFDKLPAAAETVAFVLAPDGQWRAISYLIRPQVEDEQKTADPVLPPGTEAERMAVSTAGKWLAEIDAGQYAESWTDAAGLFRAALTQRQWIVALENVRSPLGSLRSRKLHSAKTTAVPGAPAGQFVIMKFDTSFANKQSAIETVTFTLEKDGSWRAAGYFIK